MLWVAIYRYLGSSTMCYFESWFLRRLVRKGLTVKRFYRQARF
jgi:hypothetical protein